MKAMVVFSSQTGNSYKLAKAFWEGLTAEKKQIFSIDTVPDPELYDLVAVSFWLKGGQPDPKAQELLKKLKGRSVFLMATHGAAVGSDHAVKAMETAKELASGAKIVGTYDCQGEVSAPTLEMVKSKPQPPVWAADAPAAEGHPDDTELAAIRDLATKISL